MNDTYCIRPAHPDEAALITTLMRRSKAHWGYDAEFLALVMPEMYISIEQIASAAGFYVHEDGSGYVVGFYHLSVNEKGLRLEDLFIDPEVIGSGYGKRLWDHAVETAKRLGYTAFTLEADPNAETFYLKMGAVRIGTRESHIPGRYLPQMKYSILNSPS
jgi:GNAT superfamily N-acetyltransferase